MILCSFDFDAAHGMAPDLYGFVPLISKAPYHMAARFKKSGGTPPTTLFPFLVSQSLPLFIGCCMWIETYSRFSYDVLAVPRTTIVYRRSRRRRYLFLDEQNHDSMSRQNSHTVTFLPTRTALSHSWMDILLFFCTHLYRQHSHMYSAVPRFS